MRLLKQMKVHQFRILGKYYRGFQRVHAAQVVEDQQHLGEKWKKKKGMCS